MFQSNFEVFLRSQIVRKLNEQLIYIYIYIYILLDIKFGFNCDETCTKPPESFNIFCPGLSEKLLFCPLHR